MARRSRRLGRYLLGLGRPVGDRRTQGDFDRVTQVTVTDRGSIIANILLDKVRDIDGQPILPVATISVPIFQPRDRLATHEY
jgi:hypothetical protein